MTDDHCQPVERLTTLTSLLIKVKPEAFSQHGLASLVSLPDLQSLVGGFQRFVCFVGDTFSPLGPCLGGYTPWQLLQQQAIE